MSTAAWICGGVAYLAFALAVSLGWDWFEDWQKRVHRP